MKKRILFGFLVCITVSNVWAQEAPLGNSVNPNEKEQEMLTELKTKAPKGMIVWSSSRSSAKHDIWKMSPDGSDIQALTSSPQVDWFPRISPNGKSVLFNRSKTGWVSESEAENPNKWDLWLIEIATKAEKKIVENATWGTWIKNGKALLFSRASKVLEYDIESSSESLVFDGALQWDDKVVLQEPNLSSDGRYLAITLRGSQRETGIWDLQTKKWASTGEGCQIDWFPKQNKIYRMNPTGNGGSAAPSEVLQFTIQNGEPVEKMGFFGIPDEIRLMDLPGRRSHEYFPKVDQFNGNWLVWGATDKGHDHDIYDYELYLWNKETPK